MSSVVGGYEHYRAAGREAILALGHDPCLMEFSYPASPNAPQSECFRQIERSDVVILLLGSRYGEPQMSGWSPTEEEYRHAASVGKQILVFVESVEHRETPQSEFLARISDWGDGVFFRKFSNETHLMARIVEALKSFEQSVATSPPASLEKLPPICRERVASLKESSGAVADQLVALLSDPASRQRGTLSKLALQTPSWLADAGYLAWEAISEFIAAHDLGSSVLTRERAIDAGSPRSDLYLMRNAINLTDDGDLERANELIGRIEPDHPLFQIAQARIRHDPQAVIKRVTSTRLAQSEDPDRAMFCITTLVWAYSELKQFDSATRVLQEANIRFPGRDLLLFWQTHTTLGMVDQIGLRAAGSHDLLNEASELAVQARDSFREWDGPSHLAVAVGMRARLFLDDPQSAADLALLPPGGEATDTEAAEPHVQAKLARALLALGRFEEINDLQLAHAGEFESALIRAMQAHALKDPAAQSKMRRAVALAADASDLRQALLGLAWFGETDEVAMSRLQAVDAALFQGVAAFHRDDLDEAMDVLFAHRFESPNHAYYLARAQHGSGEIDDAIETLTDAAEQLGSHSLLEFAVELLIERKRLDEAESIAHEALAGISSGPSVNRVRSLLVEIANRRDDWETMESHARAILHDSPQDDRSAWRVVYALHRQSKKRQAWAYMVAHDLYPLDEDTARLTIAVSGEAGVPETDPSRLLAIARSFADSEQVSGFALGALMSEGDRFSFDDKQQSQFQEMLENFLERHPESDVLQAVKVEDPEVLLEQLSAGQQELFVQSKPLTDRVRYGGVPYGTLRIIRELPYAELLRSMAADDLTAISADPARRDHELQVVRSALEARVAVDTSVAALGVHSDLDVAHMGEAFRSVLVADELVVDARAAVAFVKRPVAAVSVYDPGLGRVNVWEISEEQRAATITSAERVLELLETWQSARSGHLVPLMSGEDSEEISMRPWDASLRVARAREYALWCDDLALRSLAESEGIAAFGTWALYEVLHSSGEHPWLPQPDEMKVRLLRAGIADVPISLEELDHATDDSDGPDAAIERFLRRPLTWHTNRSETLRWFLRHFRKSIGGPHRMRTPGLLYAASYGSGAAIDQSVRQAALGGHLALALLNVRDPGIVPYLLAATRYAGNELDPGADVDPLRDAVRHLLSGWEVDFGAAPAAKVLVWMFSQLEPDDRQTVMSIVFGSR